MDAQLKRGVLEVCVLAAMKNEAKYGYQLVKEISPYVEIAESTLYPSASQSGTIKCQY